MLKNGTIDLVWNGLTITDERKQNMEISIPYLDNEQVAVIDSVMAGYYTTTSNLKDSLMIVNNLVLATEQYGIAAKKGNTKLINEINAALKAIKDTDLKTLAAEYGLTDFVAVK